MEYFKQPVSLKDMRTIATLVGTIIIFLALPLTIFTTLQTREPIGRAQTEGGAKWTPFMRGSDQFLTDLSVDPVEANRAYVSVDVTTPRRTVNAGDNWYPPKNNFLGFPNSLDTWAVLVSPHTTGPGDRIILTAGKTGRKSEIWRSIDGETWNKVFFITDDNIIISLASDPNNTAVFYAATGNTHDLTWGGDSDNVKIFKSTNGGQNWSQVYNNPPDGDPNHSTDPNSIPSTASIFSIEVKPDDPDTLFAATDKGLFRASNATAATTANPLSFTRITVDSADPTAFIGDTQIDPESPDKMWASVKTEGVYFSSDGGYNWVPVNNGLCLTNECKNKAFYGFQRLLLVSHTDGRRLYVTNGAQQGDAGGLWAANVLGSDDGISGWTKKTNWSSNIPINWTGLKGLFFIATSKANRDRLWVAGQAGAIYRSDDKGENWTYVGATIVKKTADIDAAETAYYKNNGLAIEGLTQITVDPHDSQRIYGADIDHGLFVSVDGGESARLLFSPDFPNTGTGPGAIIIDPDLNEPYKNRLYLGVYQQTSDYPYKGGVYYSEDRGKNWTLIGGGQVGVNGLPKGNVLGLQMDLSSTIQNRILITALDGVGIYRGTHTNVADPAAWNWEPFGLNGSPGPGLSDLRTDPAEPKRMYITGPGSEARGYDVDIDSSGIYRCDDVTGAAPCNWVKIDNGEVKASTPDALVIDPQDPKRIYSIGKGGVWTTSDARAASVTWTEIKHGVDNGSVGNDTPAGVAIEENGKSVLYVGCRGRGVVRSENRQPFTDFNEVEFQDLARHTHDLKLLKVRGVDYDPVNKRLLVSTQGNGSYVRQLTVDTQPPTVDIKANGSDGPTNVIYNTAANLSWTSSNAASCTASGGWSGSKATSGSESTGSLTASKNHTLTCTGENGTAADSVTVNVGKIGDMNGDTKVDFHDFSTLVSRWGTKDQIADLNLDGAVNFHDFSTLVSRWGS